MANLKPDSLQTPCPVSLRGGRPPGRGFGLPGQHAQTWQGQECCEGSSVKPVASSFQHPFSSEATELLPTFTCQEAG